MAAEERENLLGQDEFRNFRILGLIHLALSGVIGLLGLAYFCTVVALAGTDTNATNMALVVLSTLSVCVSLAGTAIVALKFRSTNTRLKCITAVFIGQTALNMLLALLVIAIGSASIPIAIETTAQTAVVVIPILYLLFGVITFGTGVLGLYAIFFRFPHVPKKKVQQKPCKVFTVSKAHRRTPSPLSDGEGGDDRGSYEEALEVETAEIVPRGQAAVRRQGDEPRKTGSSGDGDDDGGGDGGGDGGEVKDESRERGKQSDERRRDRKKPTGAETAADKDNSRIVAAPKAARDRPRLAKSAGSAPIGADERLLIAVDALPRAAKRNAAGSAAGSGSASNGGSGRSEQREEHNPEQQEPPPPPPPPPPPSPPPSPKLSMSKGEGDSQAKPGAEGSGGDPQRSPSPQPGPSDEGDDDDH